MSCYSYPSPSGVGAASMLKTPKWRILGLKFTKIQNDRIFSFIKCEIKLEIAIALLIYVSLNDSDF